MRVTVTTKQSINTSMDQLVIAAEFLRIGNDPTQLCAELMAMMNEIKEEAANKAGVHLITMRAPTATDNGDGSYRATGVVFYFLIADTIEDLADILSGASKGHGILRVQFTLSKNGEREMRTWLRAQLRETARTDAAELSEHKISELKLVEIKYSSIDQQEDIGMLETSVMKAPHVDPAGTHEAFIKTVADVCKYATPKRQIYDEATFIFEYGA